MLLELKEVNKLPVKTFRWLGANKLNINEVIPDIKPFKRVELTGEGVKDIKVTYHNNKESENMPPTGMGDEAAAFICCHKNREMTVTVPRGKKIIEPLFLSYRLDQENPALAEELFLLAEEDSEVTLVITYEGEAGTPLFHGGLIYLMADKNATIHLIQVQLLPDGGIHFSNIGAECKECSKVNITQCELGSSHTVSGIMADLRGNKSELTVDTIYFGDKERSLDFNYVINHYGKNSKSDMKVNGALLNSSRKIFRGTIDFKKGASGSEGAEGEYTLLFDKNIKNVSVPLILCGEEDVSGKHAANSGKIDENKLFYMMSRGLSEGEAKKLMLEAWFHPAVNNIPSEALREQVFQYVKERLNHVESL
ncbi:MAG TPA: SufD family Fe-S cluster assembly protein [Mobilitalea sp.]|nr:SufD family Fe-S cluster assembly protein [Mobilitalea sp.]